MVEIQSKEVIDKISDELKVQPAMAIPRELAKDIQLVYGVNPPHEIIPIATLFGRTTTATGSSLKILSGEKDTYVTSVLLTNASTDEADNTTMFVEVVTHKGIEVRAVMMTKQTLTAFADTVVAYFNEPLLLERGSAIKFTNIFSVGASNSSILVWGYETDPQ